jgi:hypothetical protein
MSANDSSAPDNIDDIYDDGEEEPYDSRHGMFSESGDDEVEEVLGMSRTWEELERNMGNAKHGYHFTPYHHPRLHVYVHMCVSLVTSIDC